MYEETQYIIYIVYVCTCVLVQYLIIGSRTHSQYTRLLHTELIIGV